MSDTSDESALLVLSERLAHRKSGFEQWIDPALAAVATTDSAWALGESLRFDRNLQLPSKIVIAIYRRLFELGVDDVQTKVCFARYLLLHGPQWDVEAEAILDEVEDVARLAGFWDGPHLGHHPVFFGQ